MRLSLVSQFLLVFISVLALTRAQTISAPTSPLTISESTISESTTSESPTSESTTSESTTSESTTSESPTSESTTSESTTSVSTTSESTTSESTTSESTTSESTTSAPTTSESTTSESTTSESTTSAPTTSASTTSESTTSESTTSESPTSESTTSASTTSESPTSASTTSESTTSESTTSASTTSESPTSTSTTSPSTTSTSNTSASNTSASTTSASNTSASTTSASNTSASNTSASTTSASNTSASTTSASNTSASTTSASNTSASNTSASTTLAAATGIFYPFGSAAGDTEHFENGSESSVNVAFSTPFVFFGRTYNHTYVNYNGLLTFSQPVPGALPYYIPKNGAEDFIAPLWTDLNDFGLGKYSYQQYTNGSVLTRATQDIKRYFPQRAFTASWVFVATWDYVQTRNTSVFNLHSAPAITFQVVLISGGGFSFILMNYGDCAVISFPVEAGYDTINSTDYYLIHYATNGSYIPNLKNTTNVNAPGRWAFLVNSGSAPGIFYPFGSSGDTRNAAVDDGSSSVIQLLSPFLFFGRTYQQIYVNNNGHLTFDQPSSQFVPYSFPANGGQDIIAGLWTDLDNRARGVVSYHQYTNGSVLTRATQDINNHFPNLTFSASWVFVATWDKVAYFPVTNTETSFQVVLISGGNFSFILMNYGDIAVTGLQVEAGYDTVNSFDYFVIPGSNNGSFISNLKNSSNVNVPGRWAFRVDSGRNTTEHDVIGLRVKFSSFSDLTQSGNIEIVLQQIKQELVRNGLSRIDLKIRNLQKINP